MLERAGEEVVVENVRQSVLATGHVGGHEQAEAAQAVGASSAHRALLFRRHALIGVRLLPPAGFIGLFLVTVGRWTVRGLISVPALHVQATRVVQVTHVASRFFVAETPRRGLLLLLLLLLLLRHLGCLVGRRRRLLGFGAGPLPDAAGAPVADGRRRFRHEGGRDFDLRDERRGGHVRLALQPLGALLFRRRRVDERQIQLEIGYT